MVIVDKILRCKYLLRMTDEAIREDYSVVIHAGKIIDILPVNDYPSKYKPKEVFYLNRHIVMPGFVNCHNHSPMIFFRGIIPEGTTLEDVLHKYMFPLEKEFSSNPDFVYLASKAAAIEMLNAGTTTTTEMYFHSERVMQAYKEAGIRAIVGETIFSSMATPSAKSPWDSIKLAENAMKLNDGLVEAAISPHASYTVNDAAMLMCKEACKSFGMRMLMHANESQFEMEKILKRKGNEERREWPITYFSELGIFDSIKTTLAHCCHLNQKEIDNILKYDIGVALNPVSNALIGNKTANLKVMLKYLIRVGLATDGPMTNDSIDLLSQLKPAMTLYLASEPGTWLDSYKIVELATIGSARALHLDDKIGTLEKGKEADIIALDANEKAIPYIQNGNVFQYITRCSRPNDVTFRMVKGNEIPWRNPQGETAISMAKKVKEFLHGKT